MGRRQQVGVLAGVIVLVCLAANAWADEPSESDRAFRLPALDGQTVDVAASPGRQWTVVCFLGTECPLARLYGPRLQRLAADFAEKDVRFVGVFSNQQDSAEDIERYVRGHGIEFPALRDLDNRVADQYAATRTPEVVVLDSRLEIQYRGRIDDQYLPGIARPAPEREDLREALGQLLAGSSASPAETRVEGCLIGRVKQPRSESDVTYCDQIVRILNAQCVECHRAQEIGPFALTDYEEVLGWAEMIQEVVREQRMPPWHADPEFGHFQNSRGLTPEQRRLIDDWVAAGAPYGNPSQLPEPPEFIDGWQLPREPDLVVSMGDRAFTVPTEGTIEYQYFVVDPGFTEDRWITAAQVVPGNRSVVHHSIVFIRPPDGARFRGVGWLGAYVPGQRTFVLPPGRARFVPAGSKLVFQQHYTPNGRVQDDLTKVGLLFCDESEVTHEVFTLVGIDQEFEIPPHAPAHEVKGRVRWFPRDGELLAIMPHMHLRGKSFRFVARSGGNDERVILHVPRYDFNWQHVYELSEALPLGTVDELDFSVTFDNSASNPFNPNPSEYVTWGDQTWEEMAVAFFEVSQPRNARSPSSNVSPPDRRADEELNERVESFVTEFFARFDQNGDGWIERSEPPLSFRRFAFDRFDQDGDSRLSKEEIGNSARERMQSGR